MATANDIKKAKRDELEKLAPEYGVDPEGKNVDELRSAILEQVEAGGESDDDAPEGSDTTGDAPEGDDAPEEGEGDDADESDDDEEEDEPAGDNADLDEPVTPVVPNAAELAADQANAPAKEVARQKAIKNEEGPSGHPSSFDKNGQPVFGSAKVEKEEGK